MHAGPVPRTGGIAVLTALACAAALASIIESVPAAWTWVGAALLLVGSVSYLDDRGEVRPQYRLAAHLLAAVLLLVGGISWSRMELPGLVWVMPAMLAYVLTMVQVVWMINLYNFMDGMDGFAGGMTVFGFGALAVLGWQGEDPAFAAFNAAIAAAAGGFLVSNFPPARIFLGDLGSATLGLLAASMGLIGSQRGLFPLWVAWLAFSPFIVDATWTLLRRLAKGEPVWQAHRSHHYQRLVLAGWSHKKTVLRSYLLMAACAATAVAAPGMSVRDQQWLLGAWSIIYVLVAFKARLVERGARLTSP
ncbi:MAG: glycosyl transferase [Pseudomonadota bacterium]|nr:glycosyl transferase [Pseudomonadota bacterium]